MHKVTCMNVLGLGWTLVEGYYIYFEVFASAQLRLNCFERVQQTA